MIRNKLPLALLALALGACSESTNAEQGSSTTGGENSGNANTDGSNSSSGSQNSGVSNGMTEPGEVLAFPGAEGFGARVSGGRGGAVIKVTSLAASGPGSLQEALDAPGPRIIVFDVSGVIAADQIRIAHGDVTIAGQTAPGAGITIKGRLTGEYDNSVGNIIIRHLRVRPEYDGSAGEQFDGIQLSRNHHIILDHVSVTFGVDETLCLYEATDVTLQWSTIANGATSGHPEGEHNYGMINGPDGRRISVHHNLLANNKNRNPAIANGPAEVVSNVIYNARHGFVHHNLGVRTVLKDLCRQSAVNGILR